MRTLVIVLIGLFAAGCLSSGRTQYRAGPVYFGRMDLYQYKLFNPLSTNEVEDRRADGRTYWSAHFDDQGRVRTAEKYNGASSSVKLEYSYENGRLISLRQSTPDGLSRELIRQK